jgi:quercetin dioxygenase-like cupin family protein
MFVLVVEGAVTLRLGDEVHGLRSGGAITIAAAIPH